MTRQESRTFWLSNDNLILASGSRARAHLLTEAGLPFEVIQPAIDERTIERQLTASRAGAAEVAGALADAKALDVSRRNPRRLVLGSDQTLDIDGAMLNKPANRDEARSHLRLMSGHEHHLYSAATLACDGHVLFRTVDQATLTVRELSPEFIETYLDLCGAAILESVGAYQIEGAGLHLFERIDGHHATIMGLPLLRLLAGMRDLGLLRA